VGTVAGQNYTSLEASVSALGRLRRNGFGDTARRTRRGPGIGLGFEVVAGQGFGCGRERRQTRKVRTVLVGMLRERQQ